MSPGRPRPRDERGFSLIEALVALALVGFLLLSTSAIYYQQRTVARRVAAQRAADAALENSYELLRAGAWPLASGTVPDFWSSGAVLTLRVDPGEIPHSTRIDLVATYRVDGRPFRRSLQGILYTP